MLNDTKFACSSGRPLVSKLTSLNLLTLGIVQAYLTLLSLNRRIKTKTRTKIKQPKWIWNNFHLIFLIIFVFNFERSDPLHSQLYTPPRMI